MDEPEYVFAPQKLRVVWSLSKAMRLIAPKKEPKSAKPKISKRFIAKR